MEEKLNRVESENKIGLKNQKELEALMRSKKFSRRLTEEITRVYLINNLLLITSKN